ncbi:Fatty acyl-CoA reductase 2-like [Vitis vinifera]|uniref:Fatty acyl-CoA reductase n=1 Tax=Vitis vinifera TaxID=29760 RepID=A0A438I6I7_VITVI|nr:Fatty acyl-CoA reductase 2-like [Vitis vinifera]
MTMVMALTSLLPCGRGRTPASSIAKVVESDRALMQQSRTQKVRALKEMEVSTAATTNTSITNGLGILQFLPGKTYFITGATGFLAKAGVEKILRTAPDVVDVSLSTNVLGPSRLMDFTNKYCKILEFSYIFVSHAAYVSGETEGMIVEKPFHMEESIAREKAASEFPPLSYPVLDVDGEIEIALDSKVTFEGNLEDQKMKALGLERARIHGWHNPYEFTKAMGEMMINSMRGDIPLVIIRPTVIGSTLEDPFPGWIQGNRYLISLPFSCPCTKSHFFSYNYFCVSKIIYFCLGKPSECWTQ